MADNNDQVTLVFTRNFSPYNKGDVATFDKATAEALRNPTYVDSKGRTQKLAEGSPVEDYSESKHKDALVAMRGKDGDKAVEAPTVEAGRVYSGSEVEAIVAARLEAEAQRRVPLAEDQTKTPVNRQQQANGTVVTDPSPTAVAADGGDPQAVHAAQTEVSQDVKSDKKSK